MYLCMFDIYGIAHGSTYANDLYYLNQGGPGQVLVIVRLLAVMMVKLPYRPKRAFLSAYPL